MLANQTASPDLVRAEPSAPMPPYPNRLCHIDYQAHPYRCGCLRGDEESQRIYDEHCRAASAEPSTPIERGPWQPLTAHGQIQEGDWLSFTVAGRFICARAQLVIGPGTKNEEIVYNRKKNHYFCTDMAIDGTSNHKGVLVARASLEKTDHHG